MGTVSVALAIGFPIVHPLPLPWLAIAFQAFVAILFLKLLSYCIHTASLALLYKPFVAVAP